MNEMTSREFITDKKCLTKLSITVRLRQLFLILRKYGSFSFKLHRFILPIVFMPSIVLGLPKHYSDSYM